MKKISLSLSLMAVLFVLLTACGPSEEVRRVDGLIENIGAVTLDSRESIIEAEEAIAVLDEADYQQIENLDELETSRLSYNQLVDQHINELLQAEEYTQLKDFVGQLDLKALGYVKNTILENIANFLAGVSYSYVDHEVRNMVDSFIDILTLLPLENSDQHYTTDLTAIQEFQEKNIGYADLMDLHERYDSDITAADNAFALALQEKSIPKLANAYDTYNYAVEAIQYDGNEESASRYVQVNINVRDSVGTMLRALNNKDYSLYQQSLPKVVDALQERQEILEIVLEVSREALILLESIPSGSNS